MPSQKRRLSDVESLTQERDTAIEERDAAVREALGHLPHYSRYSQFGSKRLRSDEGIYQYLVSELQRTAVRHRGPRKGDPYREAPQFDVLRIERICAPRLQEKYLAEVQDVAGLCERRVQTLPDMEGALKVESYEDINVNEYLLFHGAPSNLIGRLQVQGIDHRYAGEHFGKLFGTGAYFASNSSKSDIYTEPNKDGERCLLVVRVCLGEFFLAKEPNPDKLRPPERADGRGPLNSVVALTQTEGGCVEYREVILFERAQALPQFAIWYKHKSDCSCTHCFKRASIRVQIIKGLTGVVYELDVDPDSTVESLLTEVANASGVPSHNQSLVFNGVDIQNDPHSSLSSLCLMDGSMIYLYKMRV